MYVSQDDAIILAENGTLLIDGRKRILAARWAQDNLGAPPEINNFPVIMLYDTTPHWVHHLLRAEATAGPDTIAETQ